ncbi:nuclear transport factor 2 family protein [Aestuariivirga sp.]|uniref:nuclear transport factor 2 family protein n=1 Tax=Aestuariivirga sp. TaxID=2650926 RepID=UPI003BAC35BA
MSDQAHPTQSKIVALETSYWNALCKKDGTTAARLSSENTIVTGKQGLMTVSKDSMKSLTEQGQWILNSFEFGDMAFLSPTPDIAILAYTVTQTVTMDGKTQTLHAADSSTWVRTPDGWQCCAHSEAFLDQ